MKKITQFTIRNIVTKINEIVDFITSLSRMSNDGLIEFKGIKNPSLNINLDRLRARIPRTAGGSGGSSKLWAIISQELQYASASGDPPEGYSTYACRLVSDATAAWDYLKEYQIGDAAIASDDRKYIALTVNTGNDPINSPSHWELSAEIAPQVLGYADITDMREFMPFHRSGDRVELVLIDEVYYFAQTMIHVGYGSIRWHETDDRMMAVFA